MRGITAGGLVIGHQQDQLPVGQQLQRAEANAGGDQLRAFGVGAKGVPRSW
jgi:hypothetical protein